MRRRQHCPPILRRAFRAASKPLRITCTTEGYKSWGLSSPGSTTCTDFPGSKGNMTSDAAQFAAWGVDYLKYDRCSASSSEVGDAFLEMRHALDATGRTILFSINPNGATYDSRGAISPFLANDPGYQNRRPIDWQLVSRDDQQRRYQCRPRHAGVARRLERPRYARDRRDIVRFSRPQLHGATRAYEPMGNHGGAPHHRHESRDNVESDTQSPHQPRGRRRAPPGCRRHPRLAGAR